MDLPRARSDLEGQRFGQIEWRDSVASTNSELVARAAVNAGEQVLGADFQTAGRGRRGRVWQAPARSSVLMSVLCRLDIDPSRLHLVSTAMGLAAVGAVEEVGGSRLADQVGLKWPNDVVTTSASGSGADLKVAGMLSESVVSGESVGAVVVGIGINVNYPPELPAEIAETAESLNRLLGQDLDPTRLVVAMLRHFEAELECLGTDDGRMDLMARYRRSCTTMGRDVSVEHHHLGKPRSTTGRVDGIDDSGNLLLATADGERRFAVGDVVHLRTGD